MILRNIQLCKVVVRILNLRTFHNLIAHSDENTLNFFQSDSIRMAMTDLRFLCRKCYIDHFCLHFFLTDLLLEILFGGFQKFFDLSSCLIDKLSNLRTLFRSNILHTF